jgi:hypothetical protein
MFGEAFPLHGNLQYRCTLVFIMGLLGESPTLFCAVLIVQKSACGPRDDP